MKQSLLAIFTALLCLVGLPSQASTASSEESEFLVLMVDKSSLQAQLLTWPKDPYEAKVIHRFTVAVGKVAGDKQVQGDRKTPEGIYFNDAVIPGDTLPPRYGLQAIPLDFPNPFDKSQDKSGYGIWLHGVENDSRIEEANVTKGCVAFYNQDIDSLAQLFKPKQTAVVINKTGLFEYDPGAYGRLQASVEAWQLAWQQRRHRDYLSWYHPDFRAGKHNLRSYSNYKKRVFAGYDKMQVEFDTTRLVIHQKYAVAIMNQKFQGDDRYSSFGRKTLYLGRVERGEWRILREVFHHEPVSKTLIPSDFRERLADKSIDQSTPDSVTGKTL